MKYRIKILRTIHPLVVDNYFVLTVEKRLSLIESEYSKTINKIDSNIYESGVSTV